MKNPLPPRHDVRDTWAGFADSVLNSYKYKVKLTPGGQKKGRAARQAMDAFAHNKEGLAAEMACISEVKDPELIPPMLANVKVSMPVS